MSSENSAANVSPYDKYNNSYSALHFDNYTPDSFAQKNTQEEEYICQCKNCQKKKFSGWIKFALIISIIIVILGAIAGTLYAFYPQIKNYFISLVEKNINLPAYDILEIMMFESMQDPIVMNGAVTYANELTKKYQDNKEDYYYLAFFNFLEKQIDNRLESYYVSKEAVNEVNSIVGLIKVNKFTNTYVPVLNFQDLIDHNLVNSDETEISGDIQLLVPQNTNWNISNDVFIYLTVTVSLN